MKHVLYISYTGILEPLGQSQVIAYLKGIHNTSRYKFILVSFEKVADFESDRKSFLMKELQQFNIQWIPLRYHKNPVLLATLVDVIIGFLYSMCIIFYYRISMIHVRSYIPLLIALPFRLFLRKPLIFDMRGLWADERADVGQCHRSSKQYKAIKKLESIGVKTASHIVVLTERAEQELYNLYRRSKKDISIIPCCVDVNKYIRNNFYRVSIRNSNNWNNKYVLVYSGSLGGLYLTNELIKFFSICYSIDSNIHLLILSKSNPKEISKYVDLYDLEPSTYTICNVAPLEVSQWLSASDGAISFIKPSYSKLASSPTKFAEYLACGLPVITNTGIGDLDQQISFNQLGCLVSDWSEEAYKQVWNKFQMYRDDHQFSIKCRKYAEEVYNLELGIKKYQEIYQELIPIHVEDPEL